MSKEINKNPKDVSCVNETKTLEIKKIEAKQLSLKKALQENLSKRKKTLKKSDNALKKAE